MVNINFPGLKKLFEKNYPRRFRNPSIKWTEVERVREDVNRLKHKQGREKRRKPTPSMDLTIDALESTAYLSKLAVEMRRPLCE